MTCRNYLAIFALAALHGAALFGQDLTGIWQGTLQTPAGEQRTVIRVSKDNNVLKALLFSIDQRGDPGAPSSSATLSGSAVKLVFPGIGGTYSGTLGPDGNSIAGTLTQAAPLSLNLVRANEQNAWEIPATVAAPKPVAAGVEPVFAVATIRLSSPDAHDKGLQILSGGRLMQARNFSLPDLLTFVYGIHPRQISGGPSWFETNRYDIDAKPEQDAASSEAEWRTMIAKLLADRFQLKFHREKKELSVYAITTAKLTPKLTPSTGDANGLFTFQFHGPGALMVRNAGMDDFATSLGATVLDRPVVNQTGLEGTFDLTLNWRPDEFQFTNFGLKMPTLPDNDSRPDLFKAFQQQLGLKLESTRASVDVLMIDHVELPSEN